jgi:hypothetical protein
MALRFRKEERKRKVRRKREINEKYDERGEREK